MAMGHGSWVMWVMGQLCDGSHWSWVTKDDPFPSLTQTQTYKRIIKRLMGWALHTSSIIKQFTTGTVTQRKSLPKGDGDS